MSRYVLSKTGRVHLHGRAWLHLFTGGRVPLTLCGVPGEREASEADLDGVEACRRCLRLSRMRRTT